MEIVTGKKWLLGHDTQPYATYDCLLWIRRRPASAPLTRDMEFPREEHQPVDPLLRQVEADYRDDAWTGSGRPKKKAPGDPDEAEDED